MSVNESSPNKTINTLDIIVDLSNNLGIIEPKDEPATSVVEVETNINNGYDENDYLDAEPYEDSNGEDDGLGILNCHYEGGYNDF